MPRLTPENKEFHTAQMRENICRVFAEMFAAKGDVSMEHLAERMGIAKGTIYNYFKDKGELTAAVMEIRRQAMSEQMEKLIRPEFPAAVQLETLLRIMWEDFTTYRHLPPRPRSLDILKKIVEKGMGNSEFRSMDAEEAALFIFCSMIGKFRHFLLNNIEADIEKEIRTSLEFLLPALKK